MANEKVVKVSIEYPDTLHKHVALFSDNAQMYQFINAANHLGYDEIKYCIDGEIDYDPEKDDNILFDDGVMAAVDNLEWLIWANDVFINQKTDIDWNNIPNLKTVSYLSPATKESESNKYAVIDILVKELEKCKRINDMPMIQDIILALIIRLQKENKSTWDANTVKMEYTAPLYGRSYNDGSEEN